LEQWADSITAVLDDLGSREAVLHAVDGALAPAALFAATYPSRTTALECHLHAVRPAHFGRRLMDQVVAGFAALARKAATWTVSK
jgi:hypothetical protein